jgi:hypothetical protein
MMESAGFAEKQEEKTECGSAVKQKTVGIGGIHGVWASQRTGRHH